MADEGRSAEWDEVGRRFGDLGHKLQEAWSESRSDKPESDDGKGASAALEDLKTSITRTVSHPEVKAAAGSATSTFAEALATNLRQLADWIETKQSPPPSGGETVSVDKPGS